MAQKLEAIQGLSEYNRNVVEILLDSIIEKDSVEITGGENEEKAGEIGTGQKKIRMHYFEKFIEKEALT